MLNPEIVAQLQEIHIGGVVFYGYGIIIALSITIAIFVLKRTIRNSKVKNLLTPGLLVIMMLGGIIFGRIAFVLLHIDYFTEYVDEIFKLWNGGISIFGVLTGAFIGFILYRKASKSSIRTLEFLDAIVPFVALAQSLGRWGNFVNQELYGPPTTLPWAMYISPTKRLEGYEQYETFHPAFLYESILTFIAFILLFLIPKRCRHLHEGQLSGLYAIVYGVIRLVVNRFRLDAVAEKGLVTSPDIMAIVMILIGIAVWYASQKRALHTRS